MDKLHRYVHYLI